MKFQINQIVKGVRAGVFVVLGHTNIAGEPMYVVKSVNPNNLTEVAPGEFCLPEESLKDYE